MKIDYHFGDTGGGDVAGFNDPVAANFSYEGSLTDSLIRESIQNIIDARLPGKSPARAEFNLKHIPVDALPNSERLEKIFRSCAEYADKKKTIPAAKHYRAQADILKEGRDIPMLCISDYNTCGLTGDNEDGRWFMFMRGVGINAGDPNAGGAFGLGKGAFFANSLFRTIFVSTVTDEGSKFAGKLRLLSFEQEKKLMQGNGTFGLDGQLPIRDKEEIPKIFKRVEKGTDIWVVNFLESDDWEDSICRAILGWFWPSIHWGILTVKVGDREINASNLRERMVEFFSPEDKKSSKPYNPLHFFDSYTNPEKKLEENIDVLGKVSFYGRTSENLPFPNKTMVIRNTGMIIDFKGRASPLARYAAIFECRDEKGSAILRKLENPAHTEWDWHNWKDEHGHYVEDGKTAINELELFIAGGFSKLLYSPVSQSTTIPGLAEHLGVPTVGENLSNSGNADNKVKEIVEEETGIEIGAENIDEETPTIVRTIKPIKVAKYVKAKPTPPTPPGPEPEPNPNPIPPLPPDENPEGLSIKQKELDNAVVRYIVGEETQKGRVYHFIIHADNIKESPVVRMRLLARTEDGEGELLSIASAVGERETKIADVTKKYCDFQFNNLGKAYLSVCLDDPWIMAFDPNLTILI